MFKWYINENFSLRVLKIAVLIYGFLLYADVGLQPEMSQEWSKYKKV